MTLTRLQFRCMRHAPGSQYLQWVKTRKPARFNLAASGVLPYPLIQLGARIEDIEINGPGLYGFEPLQEAIAVHCGVPPECVVSASGTSMANFIAMAVLIQPGDEVLIEYPAYEPLLAAAQYLGAEIKRFPRQSSLQDLVSDRTRLIVITNLHNPTCAGLLEPDLKNLAEIAERAGAHVLVDEVYLECMYSERMSAIRHGKHFVCTSSLTKAYGLGGLRCGWIVAEPDLARRMWHIKDLIEPSAPHPAEQLSVIAFRRLDELSGRAKAVIDPNRALFLDFLRSCSQLEVAMPDHGTCVFPRMKSGDSDHLFELLHDHYDTDVVPGRFFEMPDHFRLGIGVENSVLKEGLERLQKALETAFTA
jgi:aspartate/methionine/tyrosine aminotransferase